MKYIVISDIHGSLYYTKKMERIINKENPDKIILLGDLYYHGPRNPLTDEYNPMEVSKILNTHKDKILCVKGNCDAEVDEMISDFKFEDNIRLNINGKRFVFTHGHKYNIDNIPENVDILIYGHFHTGFIKQIDNVIYINSGSISLPKNDTTNSFLLIENDSIYLKSVNDEKTIDRINF